eukprot:2743002-Prymnesium_polylepis.1
MPTQPAAEPAGAAWVDAARRSANARLSAGGDDREEEEVRARPPPLEPSSQPGDASPRFAEARA